MKQISLSQGLYTSIDTQDFKRVNQFKWYAHRPKGSNCYYAARSYRNTKGKRGLLYLHRFILNISNSKIQVDHKDQNGLNNTRKNLRTATKQQNMRNRSVTKTNKSGFKGVDFHKGEQKYRAALTIDRKQKHLGYFNTAKEASQCYEKKAKQIFGKFYKKLERK